MAMMNKDSYLFPQITRLFTAPITRQLTSAIRWIMLLLLISLNIAFVRIIPQASQKYNLAVLLAPFEPQIHLNLAHAYWDNRNLTRAAQELSLAEEYSRSAKPKTNTYDVLGDTTSLQSLNDLWKSEPERLKREYKWWLGVVNEKPSYRDGHLALASLAYQIGRFDQAREEVQKAQLLDPQSGIASKLSKIIVQP